MCSVSGVGTEHVDFFLSFSALTGVVSVISLTLPIGVSDFSSSSSGI